ncbi:hypothetical protein BG58_31440 [Caballeronia jiangsuensis]|nr:hypothetical protein BG58_31440 [Caballeronia jiangsuensis]
MDDQAKASLATASESVKQFLTLASALLGFEVTFAKDFIVHLSFIARISAAASWLSLLLSVIAGVMVLNALTGHLAHTHRFERNTIYQPNVRIFAGAQILFFLVGLLCTLLAGSSLLFSDSGTSNDQKKTTCACDVTIHQPQQIVPVPFFLPSPAAPTPTCGTPSPAPKHRQAAKKCR